ncbi:MAG: PepSY domain-containing protein [Alphaproteobacteria bacterium]
MLAFLALFAAANTADARNRDRGDFDRGWNGPRVERVDSRAERRGDRFRDERAFDRRRFRDDYDGPPPRAREFDRPDRYRRGDRPPLDRFLPDIRRQHPGRLLDVQRGPRGDRIKWLTPDGRVIWLDMDPRTGRIRGVEGDDRPRRRR